jgi:hypothetical protein
MTFEQELIAMIERARAAGTPFADLEAAVAELCHRHSREILPPITGTLTIIEPKDTMK